MVCTPIPYYYSRHKQDTEKADDSTIYSIFNERREAISKELLCFSDSLEEGAQFKTHHGFSKTYLIIKEYFRPITAEIMENSEALANLAAAYEVPDSRVASLQVFKGDDSSSRRQRHTDAENDRLPLILSQGFVVIQAVIHRHMQLTLNNRYLLTEASSLVVKIKPSTVATQNRFITLCESNFEELVRRRYAQALTRQRLSPENVRIVLVVYVSDSSRARARNNRTTSIRRATQPRIQDAADEIAAAVEGNKVSAGPQSRLGEITRRVWAMSRAGDPNPAPTDSLPANNTFRQASRLDYLAVKSPAQQEWGELSLRLTAQRESRLRFTFLRCAPCSVYLNTHFSRMESSIMTHFQLK